MSEEKSLNFIEEIVEADLAAGKYQSIVTRFPPEPNGYLHIGHAKSICLNFGLAQKYGGKTNLRFDDTNPVTEETEYVESIKNDVKWLGFNWAEELYASNYFDQIHGFAVRLIEMGLAYVDDSTSEEIATQKGTPTQAGTPNVYRSRTVAENLQLFEDMRLGKYADGEKVLRAKIDLASSNMLMRDPIIYRIKHAHHHRTANKWCIYPMYDFAHGQSDAIENITHSVCFCDRIGIAKRDNLIDISLLEFCVREDLNKTAVRRMVVFDPLKVMITNYTGEGEILHSENNPEDPNGGTREVPFSKEIFVERDDFMEEPSKKYFRLAPGQMVRLKSAYIIKCDDFVKDANGNVTELHCSYIPESKSGSDTSGIHVKGTLHWVSAAHSIPAEVRLYDRLFNVEDVAAAEGDFKDYINTDSLTVVPHAYAEPALLNDSMGVGFQFLRKGYFCADKDSTPTKLVFNRTVGLKDTWAKEVKKGA